MTGQQKGFTLIELLIVVAILAIIATMAVPNLIAARRQANETAAIATLRSIISAQAQIRANASIDADNDGSGEYGYFAELAGGVGLRDASGGAGPHPLRPAILPAFFNGVTTAPTISGGTCVRRGYRFQIYLPHSTGFGLPEADNGGVNVIPPDPDQSENLWCCYAWPDSYGNSGRRVFFANQVGEILATNNNRQRYDGVRKYPRFWAAFKAGTANLLGSTTALNATAWDQQRWLIVH